MNIDIASSLHNKYIHGNNDAGVDDLSSLTFLIKNIPIL